MDWRGLSEVNFGLVLEGKVPATMYRPEWFIQEPPYRKGIEILMRDGASKEDVVKVIDSSYVSDAHDSVYKWNGISETENFDWTKALRTAYENFERGKKLEKISKKLKENEEVDILPLYAELGTAISGDSFGLKPASEIDFKSYKPFKPSGYDPIDKTIGGIPTDGPIIVYGLTGVGKSKFAVAVINGLLHQHPTETAAIYTLEMNAEHWLSRSLKLFPSLNEVLDRLYVSGSVRDMEELVAEVSAKNVNYVVLDDMDNMVKTSDASEYERIYRRVKEVCRFLGIPFFVLCQPNRAAKFAVESGERFLSRFDVAWSGAAENSAALQVALMTTNALDMQAETFPTSDDDLDYIIFWKSRDGWMGDYDPTKAIGPGAVVMKHSVNWYGEPYGTRDPKKPNWKLWTVQSGSKKMSKKSTKRSED